MILLEAQFSSFVFFSLFEVSHKISSPIDGTKLSWQNYFVDDNT